jgi:probable phosphoglycerate mutase
MSTTVLCIRHALTAAVGVRLTSRAPGVPLSDVGLWQAQQLQERLRGVALAAVYSSPLERAVATAEPLARDRMQPVLIVEGLTEVDFGEWTGLTFAELEANPEWQHFNRDRGTAIVPGGETAADVQQRVIATLNTLASTHPGETIAAISHGDVIRNAVLYAAATPLSLGLPSCPSPTSASGTASKSVRLRSRQSSSPMENLGYLL